MSKIRIMSEPSLLDRITTEGYIDNSMEIRVAELSPNYNTFIISISFEKEFRYHGSIDDGNNNLYLLFGGTSPIEEIEFKIKISNFTGTLVTDSDKLLFHGILIDSIKYSQVLRNKVFAIKERTL